MAVDTPDFEALSEYDDDNSTTNIVMTPSATTVTNDHNDYNDYNIDIDTVSMSTSDFLARYPPTIVGPGNTFVLRSVSCGRILTLMDGQVKLVQPGPLSRGSSVFWTCVETGGWLGFKNPASGKFLGYDKHGALVCVAGGHFEWEHFVARQRREGGCFLQLSHRGFFSDQLWYVGLLDRGAEGERLAKLAGGSDDALVWEFLEV